LTTEIFSCTHPKYGEPIRALEDRKMKRDTAAIAASIIRGTVEFTALTLFALAIAVWWILT